MVCVFMMLRLVVGLLRSMLVGLCMMVCEIVIFMCLLVEKLVVC